MRSGTTGELMSLLCFIHLQIEPERREIRPTADRGPILLCVDTSGSMRGPRETVAKVGKMWVQACWAAGAVQVLCLGTRPLPAPELAGGLVANHSGRCFLRHCRALYPWGVARRLPPRRGPCNPCGLGRVSSTLLHILQICHPHTSPRRLRWSACALLGSRSAAATCSRSRGRRRCASWSSTWTPPAWTTY